MKIFCFDREYLLGFIAEHNITTVVCKTFCLEIYEAEITEAVFSYLVIKYQPRGRVGNLFLGNLGRYFLEFTSL